MFKKISKNKIRLYLVLTVFFLSFTIGLHAASTNKAKASGKNQRTLTIYNYEEYIGKDTIKNFHQETGIQVKEIYFEDEKVHCSNECMSKRFIKKILNDLVDECVLDDE